MDIKNLQEEIERLRRSNVELTLLRDLAQDSNLSSNFDELIRTIVGKSIRAVKAEQGAIMLLEGDTGEGKTLARSVAVSGQPVALGLNQMLLGWMSVHKEPLNLADPKTDPRFKNAGWDDSTRSVACVPLLVQSDLIGALAVFNKEGAGAFTEDDMRLLAIIAGQSAQVVENARLSGVEKLHEMLKLTQSRLIQSKKMASLGSLVTGLLHELNNAFAAIHNSGDLVSRCVDRLEGLPLSGKRPEEIGRDMHKYTQMLRQVNDTVRDASRRVDRMLSSLKSFADVDEPSKSEVDLHAQIDDALVLLHHLFEDRIKVVREYGDIPMLRCHRSEIGQVFLNLLSNAANAIDSRGTVTIRTRTEGGEIVVEIIDTGRGLSEQRMEHLFDPAFSAAGATVKAGIGLFVSNNIIYRHGGQIEASSRISHGTRMIVRLPQTEIRPS